MIEAAGAAYFLSAKFDFEPKGLVIVGAIFTVIIWIANHWVMPFLFLEEGKYAPTGYRYVAWNGMLRRVKVRFNYADGKASEVELSFGEEITNIQSGFSVEYL